MSEASLELSLSSLEILDRIKSVISVDEELRPDRCSREIRVEHLENKAIMHVKWKADSDRHLRTALLSFMDTLAYTIECVEKANRI